jgi:lysine-specific demethylase 8
MKKVGQVETICNISSEEIKEKFIHKNEPVIIKGWAKNWKAGKKWTIEYLKEQIGDTEISFKKSTSNLFPDPRSLKKPKKYTVINGSLKEYLNLLMNSTKKEYYFAAGDDLYFMKNGESNKDLSPLKNDFNIPNFLNEDNIEYIGFWLSKKGASTCIHYDSNGCHNINVQVKGSKKVLLFNPSEFNNLYMHKITEPNPFYNFSQVNAQDTDLSKFPNAQKVQYIESILEEGDLLFIPSFWFHRFDHLGDFNINVNFWWKPKEYILNNLVLSWFFNESLRKIIIDQDKLLSSQNYVQEFISSKLFKKKELKHILKALENSLSSSL